MESLVILNRNGTYALAVRTVDWHNTYDTPLFTMSKTLAHMIAGPQTGIFFIEKEEFEGVPPEKCELRILRRKDREPLTLSWVLMVGDEHIHISDHEIAPLQQHAKVTFEPGEPNWETREVEKVDDQLYVLSLKAKSLQEQRAMLIAELGSKGL